MLVGAVRGRSAQIASRMHAGLRANIPARLFTSSHSRLAKSAAIPSNAAPVLSRVSPGAIMFAALARTFSTYHAAAVNSVPEKSFVPPFASPTSPLPGMAPPTSSLLPTTPADKLPGLLGVRGLHTPADFERLAREGVATAERARELLCAIPRPSDALCVQLVDDVSNALCVVVDAAEFARSFHRSPAWRSAASAAWYEIQGALTQFSLDVNISSVLREVRRSPGFPDLTAEQQRIVTGMLLSLPRAANSAAAEKQSLQIADVMRLESVASAAMDASSVSSSALTVHFPDLTAEKYPGLKGMQGRLPIRFRRAPFDVPVFPSSAPGSSRASDGAEMSLRPWLVTKLMTKIADRPLRRDITAAASATNGYDALPLLSALVAARDAGCRFSSQLSYADGAAHVHVTRSAALSTSLLLSIRAGLEPLVDAEVAALERAARAVKQLPTRSGGSSLDPADTAPLPPALRAPLTLRARKIAKDVRGHLAAAAEGQVIESSSQQAAGGFLGKLKSAFTRGRDSGEEMHTSSLTPLSEAASLLGASASEAESGKLDPRQWLLRGNAARAGSAAATAGARTPLRAHDTDFLRSDGQDARANSDDTTLREHLTVQNVINGLALWAHSLFGISLVPAPIRSDEGWLSGAGAGGEGGPVLKLLVVDHSPQANPAANGSAEATAAAEAGLLQGGELLGVVYLDLFARSGKPAVAATYTISCGRVNHPDLTADPVDVSSLYPTLAGTGVGCGLPPSPGVGATYQMPVSVVTMPFPLLRPSSPAAGPAPLLIAPDSLDTVFHEMGHVLHATIARTQHQHLSGSRGELDYVETPSTLAEFFSTDARVVSRYARHWATGAPPPADLLRRRARHSGLFCGIDTLDNVFMSLLDQRLFGVPAAFDPERVFPQFEPRFEAKILSPTAAARAASTAASTMVATEGAAPGPLSNAAATSVADALGFYSRPAEETLASVAEEVPTVASSVLSHPHAHPSQIYLLAHQLRTATHPIPLPQGSVSFASFGHLVAYGGSFYTYLFCRVFANAIWRKHFAADPLSPAAGAKLRRMLACGGARRPLDVLCELLDDDVGAEEECKDDSSQQLSLPVMMMPRNPTTGEVIDDALATTLPWAPKPDEDAEDPAPLEARHLRTLRAAVDLYVEHTVAEGKMALEECFHAGK